jgi:hypothetical protein
MRWQVEYMAEKGIVLVTAAGPVTYHDVLLQVDQAARLMNEHKAVLVLADYVEARSELSLAQLYFLARDYSKVEGASHARAAVVVPRTRHRIETYEFHALAAKNAGYNVQLFDTKAAAEEWLCQPATVP